MAPEPDDQLLETAEMFADIARALATHESLDLVLERIVHLAAEHLEECDHAGISFVEGRRITSPASTGDVPETVDQIQEEVDEGPCLDAIREHEVFKTGELSSEERWPAFARRAFEETRVLSILSLRLFVEDDTMGALNLYSERLNAFEETDIALGSVFAAHAAVAMQSARREHDLERKADSRDLIGKAKGMVMASSDLDDAAAFDVLRRASQRLNIKLIDVAEDIVHRRPPGGGPSHPKWQ